MKKNRKWLEGEVKFVEGKTTIDTLLETLAREIVSQNWIEYNKNPKDKAWVFDTKREVWLRDIFKKENIKVFKATIKDKEYVKGEELKQGEDYTLVQNVIRGKGKGNENGTSIGDKILIEVNYEAEEFQRATFIKKVYPSGEFETVATLKSRPQGKIYLYNDTITHIKDEVLHQEGGNEVYEFSRAPVSDTEKAEHKLEVKVNGTKKELGVDFDVDFYNGYLIFRDTLEDSDVVTATYGHKTGIRKDLIPDSKYKIYKNEIIDTTGGELEGKDVMVDVDYYWKLHYPEKVEDIKDLEEKRIVLKTTVDISTAKDWSLTKDYYWELKYYDKEEEEEDYKTGVLSRYGATLDKEDDTTLDDELSGEWGKLSWYKSIGFEEGLVFDDWLPIRYWLSFTQEHLNLVLQGDPSPDKHPYKNYIIAYAYLGMLTPYEGAEREDLQNNFAYTISSDKHPMAEEEYSTKWGVNTGTGVSDILMEKTDSNIPYQAHYPSFHTSPEFMDKHFIQASEFTGSHHFSEVTVTHAYERERGKLQNMLIGDRSSIFHLDELISNKDNVNYSGVLIDHENNHKNKCGQPLKSKEKRWVMFNINAPYWFGNNSPNVHYGIAIRKS